MIKLIIFDLNGVLYRYDQEWRIGQFAERSGRSVAEVRRVWQESGWEDAADRGRFRTGGDYLAAFNDLLGTDFTLDEWADHCRNAMSPNEEALKAAAGAREHATIAVLTNNGPLLREQIGRIAPRLPPLFGGNIYTSSDFCARKPEAAIFEAIMSRYGVSAAETAFIDDSQTHVAGAQALGIAAHHFRSAEGLAVFLSELY